MMQWMANIYHAFLAISNQIRYKFPSRELTLIGVTGTSGKTTVVHLVHSILSEAGIKVAMISTVEARIGEKILDTGFHVTTPDPWIIPRLLRQAVNAGCDVMVMEVSSHGLDQNRVFGCSFELGVLTNISHEHLDYHKTLENYLKAKIKLLSIAKTAILNADDELYQQVKQRLPSKKKIITYGIEKQAQVMPKSLPFKTKMPGKFNLYNCLAAIAVGKFFKLNDQEIKRGIEKFRGVPGRFESIPNKKGIHLIIDFAHKPNALKSVLKTARNLYKSGRIIAVFGAAGERDWLKRPMMGEISARYADVSILTAEDPRAENVNDIIAQISRGCQQGGAMEKKLSSLNQRSEFTKTFFRISDRQKAITFAVNRVAEKGDTVLLLGKGHEKSMCYGKTEYPWNEYVAVKIALKK